MKFSRVILNISRVTVAVVVTVVPLEITVAD